jgi:hypothetical protein
MNIPRRLQPAARQVTFAPGRSAVAISPYRHAGITPSIAPGVVPAGSSDDDCRQQCRSVRTDSGYNLCVQLCRTSGR